MQEMISVSDAVCSAVVEGDALSVHSVVGEPVSVFPGRRIFDFARQNRSRSFLRSEVYARAKPC